MARVLIHFFPNGDQPYIEETDEAMVRRIAEILCRNLAEIDAAEVVEEIIECFQDPATIETAEVAIGLYCEVVPLEGFTLSIPHGVTVLNVNEPPPLTESVAEMRKYVEELRNA